MAIRPRPGAAQPTRLRVKAARVTDNWPAVRDALLTLADTRLMVGIPQATAPRQGGGPSNALLGYVHEFGAPDKNIPARPFLIPGVRNARTEVVNGLKAAAGHALDGKREAVLRQLAITGTQATNAVQQRITDGPFAPLSPNTLRARQRKLRGNRPLTRAQLKAGFADIRPLIDTGQLRRSITWVIRQVGKTDVAQPGKGGGGGANQSAQQQSAATGPLGRVGWPALWGNP